MVQSLNSKVDLTMTGTSFMGLGKYGKLMIGDKAFEFYNDRDVNDYMQIPWEEVDYVLASVMFGGRWIPRLAIRTKKNGDYTFSAKNPKKLLGAMKPYVPADHMVRSLTFWQVVTRGVKAKFNKKKA